jgi:methionyl-tRNA synthetase
MVGKDIIRFHAVYWPAFLMAAGLEPPKRVYAHGWWTIEGQKMSKSLGNVISPGALVEKYGLDPVRFFLLREMPFGSDGDFSHRSMVGRLNTELANDLGNLAQRSLSMINKNCGASVPMPGPFNDDDKAMLDPAGSLLERVRQALDIQAFHEALETVWVVVRAANVYVDRQAPWALKKTDPARMGTVLYVLAETVRRIGLILKPFMPTSMDRLLDQLAVPADQRDFSAWGKALVGGTPLPAPQGLFPRYQEPEEAAK